MYSGVDREGCLPASASNLPCSYSVSFRILCSSLVLCSAALFCIRIVAWATSRCQAVQCSSFIFLEGCRCSLVGPRRPSASRAGSCCLPLFSSHPLCSSYILPTSFILFAAPASFASLLLLPLPASFILSASSSPLDLSAALSISQHFSVSLSSSVHLCSFPPRLAARSGLPCTSLYIYVLSVPLCTLRESLASLSLAVVALAGSRDCFSGSYGALSHTWAFIKSLILKDKFEYLYSDSLIYIKMLDMRGEAIDNAIHRSKRYRSEVLQQGKFKEVQDVQDVLDKPSEVCRMRIMQYSKTALSQSDALPRWPNGQQANTRQYVRVIWCQAYRVKSRSVSSDRCRYPVLARMNGLDKHKS